MNVDATAMTAPRLHESNNLDIMRLGFAVLVLVAHSYEFLDGNNSREPLTRVFHTLSLGELAVDFFFILSGFLITASWDREPRWGAFLRKRIFRIYPGFIVASLLSVLVVGAIGSSNPETYWNQLSSQYIVKQLVFLSLPNTPNTFGGTHYHIVNGALWTIRFEFLCYLGVLGLGLIGVTRSRWALIVLWLASLSLFLAFRIYADTPDTPGTVGGTVPSFIRFSAMFLSGAAAYKLGISTRSASFWTVGFASVALFAGMFFPVTAEFAVATAGSYLIFVLGFARFDRKALRKLPDISYGVYLYGWPAGKLTIYAGVSDPLAVIGFSLAGATIMAMLSWRFVEGPALRLSRLYIRRHHIARWLQLPSLIVQKEKSASAGRVGRERTLPQDASASVKLSRDPRRLKTAIHGT